MAGFAVPAALELDETSAATYALNHPSTQLMQQDIRDVTGPQLLAAANLAKGSLTLLTGCPPCQGFSTLQTRRRQSTVNTERNDLVFEVLRLTRSIRPLAIMVENVPGLAQNHRFQTFRLGLEKSGYRSDFAVLDARDFGVPQRRKRLVLIALRGKRLPKSWSDYKVSLRTVRDAIGNLPAAGESGDVLHDLLSRRSPAVLERIKATPPDGGSRVDIPAAMECKCHSSNVGYSDVYGRMAWDSEAPTITSGCHNPSKGRFLHPQEHRAITLREAALLQSFPANYAFNLKRGKEHVARQIGNAFPPRMIAPIARTIYEAILQ